MTLQTTAPFPSDAAASRSGSLAGVLPWTALFCALLCVWIVQHSYIGLFHDAQLYLIQALGRFDPATYSQDIYLRLGSQDRFTVFSPLFAAAMHVFGIENAAAVITLLSHVAFFTATAWLARLILPARFVWLGIALVCALPGMYGGGGIFSVVEDFAAPRLLAETLAIVALIAFLKQRYWLAGILAVFAAAVHPLMAAGAVVVAILMDTTPLRVRAWIIAGAVAAGGALLAWMGAHSVPLRFDDQWLELLTAGVPYLFPTGWTVRTWAPTLVSMFTLAAGAVALDRSPARSLCQASLLASVVGIAFSYVAGDLLHLVLAVQGQAWRWSWVGSLIALLLLPLIAHQLWSRGALGRAATLLLVATWLCRLEPYGIEIGVIALVAVLAAVRHPATLPASKERLILFGAWGAFGLALIYHLATLRLFAEAAPDISEVPRFLQDVRAYARGGVLSFVIFALIFIATRRFTSRAPQVGIVAACLVMLAPLAPAAVQEWNIRLYTRDHSAFGEWRALIPPGTEVLWFDSPVSVWMLLERPSYLSNQQESSGVFSRPAAMAMKHRVDVLDPYLASERGAAWRDARNKKLDEAESAHKPVPLASLCAAAPDLRFIVTGKDLAATPVDVAPRGVSLRYRSLRLYRCGVPRG